MRRADAPDARARSSPDARHPPCAPAVVAGAPLHPFPGQGAACRRTVAQVHAVEDVSFTLNAGETPSLVGESGSGHHGRALGPGWLVEPTSGQVELGGRTSSPWRQTSYAARVATCR